MVWGGSGMSYRLDNGALTKLLAGQQVVSGGMSADGSLAVHSVGAGEHLYLHDSKWNELARLPAGTEPWAGISADGTRLSANSLRTLYCWDTASRRLLWEREKDFPFIRGSPLHTPDGRFLIAHTGIHPAILNIENGDVMAQLIPAVTMTTSTASLDSAGKYLALSGRGYVVLWVLRELSAEMQHRGMWPTGN